MIRPRALAPGDTVGIVAPCLAPPAEHMEVSAEHLRQKGFKVKYGENLFQSTYGFAASPEERAGDFNAMVKDPEVSMIFFGGGEVGNEILPLIDYEAVRNHPKIMMSYSDGTSVLNAVTSCSGLVTYYGQSPRTFYDLTEYNFSCFQNALMKAEPYEFTPNSRWEVLHPGKCEGILTGGYLLNYALLQNSRYFRTQSGKKYILFLEDHVMFNQPAAVSRYFSHMEQAGLFDLASGLIWGHYAEEEHPEIDEILLRVAGRHRIPTVRCGDFGHGENNAVLPVGIAAALDADKKTLRFKESPVLPR